MKKLNVTLLLVFSLAIFNTSCNRYVSIHNATKIGELRGNPFMYQVSKSVVKNLSKYSEKAGIKSDKINLLTSLSSIYSSSEQIGGLKDMLTLAYNIPAQTINSNFGNLSTVKDLIGFVAKNGKGFNFYKWNSAL